VKWSAVVLPFSAVRCEELSLGFLCLSEGKFGGNGNESVEFCIELHDAGEHDLGQLNRRELALAEKFSDLFYRSEGDLRVVVRAQNIFS
jgi:hypothetical protein